LSTVTSAVERAAAFHPLRIVCLEKALATRFILALFRERSRVILGVCRSGDSIDAHAWVEVQHQSVDAARVRFINFVQLR
jgi:hypothetical protein